MQIRAKDFQSIQRRLNAMWNLLFPAQGSAEIYAKFLQSIRPIIRVSLRHQHLWTKNTNTHQHYYRSQYECSNDLTIYQKNCAAQYTSFKAKSTCSR